MKLPNRWTVEQSLGLWESVWLNDLGGKTFVGPGYATRAEAEAACFRQHTEAVGPVTVKLYPGMNHPVAVKHGDGKTLLLTADEAEAVGAALLATARAMKKTQVPA